MRTPPLEPAEITVLIPTFNRLATLRLCLHALEAQTFKTFDVLVVNDGSTDDTAAALADIKYSSPLNLRVLHQKNAGPARARNVGLVQVTTPLCLLLGDDILATPSLVDAHCRFHKTNPRREAVALGLTEWDRHHQNLTLFMRWYETVQFQYASLLSGLTPDWRHFYTSNLSFKTALLQANPFNERFADAAWEDLELGYRLETTAQLDLRFVPAARATHVHPTTFLQAARRMRVVGRTEHLFHSIAPATITITTPTGPKAGISTFLARHPALLRMLTPAGVWLARRRPGKLHTMLLRGYHQQGYLEADRHS